MAGWPDLSVDAEQLVAEISSRTKQLKAEFTTWRASINNTSGTTGLLAADRYQSLAAYRTFMAGVVGGNAADISAVYLRRRPALGSFDPAARWAELDDQIVAFLDWFATNWPKKAPTGELAFRAINAMSRELEDLSVTLLAGAKGQLLARIDAVIAALPTQ